MLFAGSPSRESATDFFYVLISFIASQPNSLLISTNVDTTSLCLSVGFRVDVFAELVTIECLIANKC